MRVPVAKPVIWLEWITLSFRAAVASFISWGWLHCLEKALNALRNCSRPSRQLVVTGPGGNWLGLPMSLT